MEIVLFFAFGLTVAGISFAVMLRRERLRREAASAWAEANGWSYDGSELRGELGPFKLGRQGRNQRSMNVLRRRRDGVELTLFDHIYVTGSGKSRSAHHQTVCIVGGESGRVPTFFLRRQVPVFDAIGKFFGGQDVNFDEDPDFSSRYVLQSHEGDEVVRGAFRPHVRAHFTEANASGLVAEGAGGRLLIHRGVFLKPEELQAFADEALAIYALWR